MDTDVEDLKVMLNRRRTRLGAVVVGATLLIGAAAALSACSAGQVTQTDSQVASVPGVNVNSVDGQIALRNAMIDYAAKYEPNTVVPLDLRFVNESTKAARVTGAVMADGNGTVLLVSGSSSASSTPSPAAPPSPSGSASPSAPAAEPSPTAIGSAQVNVELPVGQLIVLSSSQPGGSYLVITKRSSEILPGTTVAVNFTITYSDGTDPTTLTANLPVGVPLSPPTQEPPASA